MVQQARHEGLLGFVFQERVPGLLLRDHDGLVRLNIVQSLDYTTGPADLDGVHDSPFTQSEVKLISIL